jgi:hypothetical protein
LLQDRRVSNPAKIGLEARIGLNVSVDALGFIGRKRQKETARRIAGPFLFWELVDIPRQDHTP